MDTNAQALSPIQYNFMILNQWSVKMETLFLIAQNLGEDKVNRCAWKHAVNSKALL